MQNNQEHEITQPAVENSLRSRLFSGLSNMASWTKNQADKLQVAEKTAAFTQEFKVKAGQAVHAIKDKTEQAANGLKNVAGTTAQSALNLATEKALESAENARNYYLGRGSLNDSLQALYKVVTHTEKPAFNEVQSSLNKYLEAISNLDYTKKANAELSVNLLNQFDGIFKKSVEEYAKTKPHGLTGSEAREFLHVAQQYQQVLEQNVKENPEVANRGYKVFNHSKSMIDVVMDKMPVPQTEFSQNMQALFNHSASALLNAQALKSMTVLGLDTSSIENELRNNQIYINSYSNGVRQSQISTALQGMNAMKDIENYSNATSLLIHEAGQNVTESGKKIDNTQDWVNTRIGVTQDLDNVAMSIKQLMQETELKKEQQFTMK